MPLPVDTASALRLGETLLSGTGSAALTVVKHVPGRALLWGAVGFAAGLLAIVLSALLAWLLFGSAGALFGGWRLAVTALLPVAGAVLFFFHGSNRGVAHAVLALEAQWGLVRQVVDRVYALLQPQFGERLGNLPLAQAEAAIKQGVQRFLGSESGGGRGMGAWLLGKVRGLVTAKVEACLLAAYRAELTDSGGGGVYLAKVRERTVEELSGHLAERVLDPLNTQLLLFLLLFFGVALGWYPLVEGALALAR
jgi:hypothetical protein